MKMQTSVSILAILEAPTPPIPPTPPPAHFQFLPIFEGLKVPHF